MVAVFVHGVPESADVWDDVRDLLTVDAHIAVTLPGFRAPVPDGFDATMDSYASWLLAGLEAVAAVHGPVDLVGHDWGGILALRVATLRPDLLRSWVSDAASLLDPEARWHAVASIWQEEGAGESFMAGAEAASAADLAAASVALGVPAGRASRVALGDPVMDRCILALYRSATQVMHTWGSEVERAGASPGLVVTPTEDHFLDAGLARRTAARTGARVEVLEGVGHFWPLQVPERGAALLESFWKEP